ADGYCTGLMAQASTFLLSPQPRARWMRFDTAQLLKRFFFCERSLLVSMAAWIPAIAPLEIKTGLARFIWQSAENAHALRNRVFEHWAESALSGNPELREGALAWTEAVGNRLSDVGGVGVAPSASAPAAGPLSGSKTYTIPARPARDPRFWPCRFYWPDIIDPN